MILRGLAVFLVCLNLGVALWWSLHRDAPPPAPPPLAAGTAGLVLLGEAEAPPPPDQAELGAVPVPMPDAAACVSLGPFPTPAELRVTMNALTPHVARIEFREVAATASRGWRVFLPAAGTRDAALATARELSGKGVEDIFVVTSGAAENTVSLGMFRDRANAEKRRDELAALGYQPVLEPGTAEGAEWWIDFTAEPGFDWRARVPRPDGLEARAVACE